MHMTTMRYAWPWRRVVGDLISFNYRDFGEILAQHTCREQACQAAPDHNGSHNPDCFCFLRPQLRCTVQAKPLLRGFRVLTSRGSPSLASACLARGMRVALESPYPRGVLVSSRANRSRGTTRSP